MAAWRTIAHSIVGVAIRQRHIPVRKSPICNRVESNPKVLRRKENLAIRIGAQLWTSSNTLRHQQHLFWLRLANHPVTEDTNAHLSSHRSFRLSQLRQLPGDPTNPGFSGRSSHPHRRHRYSSHRERAVQGKGRRGVGQTSRWWRDGIKKVIHNGGTRFSGTWPPRNPQLYSSRFE